MYLMSLGQTLSDLQESDLASSHILTPLDFESCVQHYTFCFLQEIGICEV